VRALLTHCTDPMLRIFHRLLLVNKVSEVMGRRLGSRKG
jgi:hypothetical protein